MSCSSCFIYRPGIFPISLNLGKTLRSFKSVVKMTCHILDLIFYDNSLQCSRLTLVRVDHCCEPSVYSLICFSLARHVLGLFRLLDRLFGLLIGEVLPKLS